MKGKRKYIHILMLILCLGAFLRTFKLGTIPSGFFRDEAWNGYEAFSLLKTGKDSEGRSFPLFFAQYGNIHFSSPFVYASIPFIFTFGLNEFATRLPAAVFGILTIWLTYLCAQEFFGRRVALISSFLVAISPWHIQYSRLAFRAITLPFFFLLAVYLLKKGLRDKKYIYAGFAVLGVSMYTYSTANIFVPLFLLGFLIIYRRYLLTIKKETIVALIIFAVIAAPVIRHGLTPEGQAHFRGDTYLGHKFHPVYIKPFLKRYTGYFSPGFLFISGQSDFPWPSPWQFGQLYIFKLPLILIGLYIFISQRTKGHKLFLFWLFIYPITASLTEAYYHSLRTINIIPVFQVLAAQGAYSLFQFLKKRGKKWLIPGYVLCALALCKVGYYTYSYFVKYPRYSAPALQYGYRDAIKYIESLKTKEDIVIMSRNLTFPHIFVLFYTKYDPVEFQKSPFGLSTFGSKYPAFGKIGDYYFSFDHSEDWKDFKGRYLYLSEPRKRKRKDRPILKTIYFPNGYPAFQIAEMFK